MNALNLFESALAVMEENTRLLIRADELTRKYSAFDSFSDLIYCNRNYRPSISMAIPEKRALADLYDAAQTERGDDRRAYRFGACNRKGSLIDRAHWDTEEEWYRLGNRIAWYDRRSKQWIVYTVNVQGHQQGNADFYYRALDLLHSEHSHAA